jgi:ABC-2 type transport system ATP-binding protein
MNLDLINISKSFGEKQVLKGISFFAQSGKAFGLLGRNGAGKTTTLRILMHVFPADSGSVLLDGKPIDYARVQLGYLPEERGLYPKKKIIDQLVYFTQLKGLSKSDAVASIDYWLDRLGMREYRSKRLDTLSKGNQQKIQLITAVAHDPQIVILDEPFSGLDPVNAMLLKSVVREEIEKGKIVLFSSHQMNYIEEFCDNIAILRGGQIVLSGELHEIKRSYPRNRLVVRSGQRAQILADLGNCCRALEDDAVLITLPSPDEKASMMAHLISHYDVDEVKVFEPTLNDIFVEYTGERSDEQTPDKEVLK